MWLSLSSVASFWIPNYIDWCADTRHMARNQTKWEMFSISILLHCWLNWHKFRPIRLEDCWDSFLSSSDSASNKAIYNIFSLNFCLSRSLCVLFSGLFAPNSIKINVFTTIYVSSHGSFSFSLFSFHFFLPSLIVHVDADTLFWLIFSTLAS